MYCKKCGEFVPDGSKVCPKCGQEILAERGEALKENDKMIKKENLSSTTNSSETRTMSDEKNSKKISGWCWCAIASFLCGCFTFYKGIDRLVNYDSGEHYPYETVNAYVGGDAYNYIINGTHATAFFVLTTMFVLAGIGLIIIHYVSRRRKEIN